MLPSALRAARPLLALAFAALLGCSSSTPKPPDTPDTSADPPGDGPAKGDDKPEADAEKPLNKVIKGGGNPNADVPDDYAMSDGDCEELGRQYGNVQKADLRAQLDAKVNAKQRAAAEANFEDAAAKLGEGWAERCHKSLVGGIVDRKNLKCAMTSRSVKDFDICLNGAEAPAEEGKGGGNPSADKPRKKK